MAPGQKQFQETRYALAPGLKKTFYEYTMMSSGIEHITMVIDLLMGMALIRLK